MENYRIEKLVGEGGFGKVHRAVDIRSTTTVAMKLTSIDKKYGASFITVREIRALKTLKNPMVIDLLDVFRDADTFILVFPYMPYDLSGLLRSGYRFSDAQFSSIAHQLVIGVSYIHSKGFIHRDLKPSNILLDATGRLKIADLGSTREPVSHMTNRICTLWYRAPELLLGRDAYSYKVDSWSIGCILLEIKCGKPLFSGESEISQVKEIFSKLGCPESPSPWDELFNIEQYKKTEPWDEIVRSLFEHVLDKRVLALVGELLRLDPDKRLSVENALRLRSLWPSAVRLLPIKHADVHDMRTKGTKSPGRDRDAAREHAAAGRRTNI